MSRRPNYPSTASYGSFNSTPEGIVQSPIGNDPNGYPQVLDPEHGPQTVHRSDVFFVNNPHMNPRQNPDFSQRSYAAPGPPVPNQLYPYHQQAFHHYSPPAPSPPGDFYPQYQPPPPSYPQNLVANQALVPPLPPKPIIYPSVKNTTNYDQHVARPPASLPPPASYPSPPISYAQPPLSPSLPPPLPLEEEEVVSPTEDDSNELAMALALSQSESIEHQKLQEQLRNQEEEDLARALAESMKLTADSPFNPFFVPRPEENRNLPNNNPEPLHQTPTPPAPALVDLPSQNTSSTSHSPNILPCDKPFPEFGRYEKWRLPGVSGNTLNEAPSANNETEISSIDLSTDFLTVSAREDTSASRRLSVASVSSLAYMLPEEPESQDGKDAESAQDQDNEVQDGKDVPESPNVAKIESISRDTTPPEISAKTEDLCLIIPEELVEPHVLVFDDEAYARQLAAEEEALAAQEYQNEKARPMPTYDTDPSQDLPLYTPDDRQRNVSEGTSSSNYPYTERQPMYPSSVGGYNGTSSTPPSTSYMTPKYASHHPDQAFPLYGRRVSDPNNFRPPFPSSSSSASMSAVPHSPVVYPSLRNRRDTEADTFSEASHQSSNSSAATAPAALPSSNQSSSPPPPAFSEPRTPASAMSMAPAGVLNANHFLDRELLLGVSIGFKPPPISLILRPMEDPMPNIISLPYARCPPLHLQAPNWSHLLRLMARLSGTRIEPTVEAMAVNKGELKLRTVIQFIKPTPQVNDWRTILWFTIDHLVPPSAPGASRYTSGNPNLLPWSYTLSPVPLLLRDATDTHISKTYTIPASDSVPLPTLPITFPNLALYLQAALDASRQHSGDSSSGLGKLGKTVQMCYPNVGQTGLSEFDIPERTSVSHLFKRVIGRSNKDKKKGKTSNNEETYQLVTPFVPDEWG